MSELIRLPVKPRKFEYEELKAFGASMTDEQSERIDSILSAIEREDEATRDYYTHNEDNPVADYVASIGYGGELLHQVEDSLESIYMRRTGSYRLDERTDEICTFFQRLIKSGDRRAAVDALIEVCDLVCIGIYGDDWELCSMTVGEVESQLSDELIERLNALTPIERAYVERQVCIRGEYSYVPCEYDRWVMKLDYERACTYIDSHTEGAADEQD